MDNNFLKEKFNDIRYKMAFRYFFEPKKAFLEETRILFLSKLTGKEVVTKHRFSRIYHIEPIWRYTFSLILIIFLLGGGIVIFADARNVSVDHPLYGAKRTGEKIRFVFCSQSKEPFLYQKFAQRRIGEIESLEAKRVELVEIQKEMLEDLDQELGRDIFLAMEYTNMHGFPQEMTPTLCNEMLQMLKESEYAISETSHAMQNLREHCLEFMAGDEFFQVKP